jgi:OOP family OmpA-OmpF porin
MRMKRVLLASSALTLLAAMGQAQAKDLYVSVLAGANWLSDSSATTPSGDTGHSFDGDTGFLLGAAFGTSLDKWARGLRTELEVSFRRNDLGGSWFTDFPSTGGIIDGNLSTFAIMANLWYDIDVGSKFRPYVGGGAGWARSHFEAAFITTFTDGGPSVDLNEIRRVDNSGFAWHLGLGFNYEVMPGVDAGLGYRYFEGPRIRTFFEGKQQLRMDNDNHTVFVNLTVNID